MRDYGQIQSQFWTNPDIQSLSDFGKLLAAYLLTSPHTNGIGCFRMPLGYLSEDFGKGSETVKETLSELSNIGFLSYCETTKYLLVHNFMKWNPLANPNVAKSRQKEFDLVPKKFMYIKELCMEMLENGNHFDPEYVNRFETLLKPFANPEPEPEPEPEPSSCSEPQSGSKLKVVKADTPVIELMLNDKTMHPVTSEDFELWKSLYPAVDVMQELRGMVGWIKSNPTKRKTKAGIDNFIKTWLSRRQDKGGSSGAVSSSKTNRSELAKQWAEEHRNARA